MDPLTAGITYSAAAGGAGAGGGAAAGAMANPIAAAIIAAALGTAYGTSPTVRKKTNKFVKSGWEGLSNPFQHYGDGSEKDTLSPKLMGFNSISGLGSAGLDPGSRFPVQGMGQINTTESQVTKVLQSLMNDESRNKTSQRQKQQSKQDDSLRFDPAFGTGLYQPLDVGYFQVPEAKQMYAPTPEDLYLRRSPYYGY